MSSPIVSVLTPSLNQGRFIGDCLLSVERQTYRPIEHVVFDGGSIDGTLELLRASGPHVLWTSRADSGQADALNQAFAASRGEVVGWLNSDDAYADRRTVARAVEAFSEDERIDVVYGHALLVNEQNEALQVLGTLPFHAALYRLVHYVVQPSVFIRRSVLDAEPFFVRTDLRYVIDRDLFIRLSRRSLFHRVPEVFGVDRHQRQRKVLDAEFPLEAASYDASIGIEDTTSARVSRRALRIAMRVAGLPAMALLPARLDSAFDLHIPGLGRRLWLQLLTPRSSMRF